MKKLLFIFMLLTGLILLGSCSSEDNEPKVPSTEETETVPDGKALIVYYSFTNNVHRIVRDLQTQIDADVIRIEPA